MELTGLIPCLGLSCDYGLYPTTTCSEWNQVAATPGLIKKSSVLPARCIVALPYRDLPEGAENGSLACDGFATDSRHGRILGACLIAFPGGDLLRAPTEEVDIDGLRHVVPDYSKRHVFVLILLSVDCRALRGRRLGPLWRCHPPRRSDFCLAGTCGLPESGNRSLSISGSTWPVQNLNK